MNVLQVTSRPVRRRRALVVAGATVAAALPWIAAWAAGEELVAAAVGQSPMEVTLPLVVTGALGASLAGWGALALLERRTGRARRIWTAVAVATLLVSLVGPLTADAPAGTKAYLALMHIAVGAVLVPGLRTTSAAQVAAGETSPDS